MRRGIVLVEDDLALRESLGTHLHGEAHPLLRPQRLEERHLAEQPGDGGGLRGRLHARQCGRGLGP